MANMYILNVQNSTGAPQNYSFFAAAPSVSGMAPDAIWSNIIKTSGMTPNGATATLQVHPSYFAVCGQFEGNLGDGAKSIISKSVAVTLGTERESGSSISLSVYEGSVCDLGRPTDPGQGKAGSFQLTTESSFTNQDARQNNFLVGIGASERTGVNAVASFVPMPSSQYQIQPSTTYYVCYGSRFEVGSFVKPEQVSNAKAVDFKGGDKITMVHNSNGEFEVR